MYPRPLLQASIKVYRSQHQLRQPAPKTPRPRPNIYLAPLSTQIDQHHNLLPTRAQHPMPHRYSLQVQRLTNRIDNLSFPIHPATLPRSEITLILKLTNGIMVAGQRPLTIEQALLKAIVDGTVAGEGSSGGFLIGFLGPFRSAGATRTRPRQDRRPGELQNSLAAFGPRWA
jgi:hypothetical protein